VKIQKVPQSGILLLSLHLHYNNIQSKQMSNIVCTDLFTVSCKDVRLSSFFRNFRELRFLRILFQKMSLAGRVCLVTGASRGIGKGCAKALAEQGKFIKLFKS